MKRAKNAALVLCLFIVYCVLLSQGLKASAASTFFGALAAVPLTVHIYNRVWPPTMPQRPARRWDRRATRADFVEPESRNIDVRNSDRQ
jgi:hypothetical protein